jgi:AbrB family looped-hinge helix DNA binding protein
MAKVTSKLQVTIPKAIATRHGIAPGDEVEWSDAGESIRLVRVEKRIRRRATIEDRLNWFDQATERQKVRKAAAPVDVAPAGSGRGWTRKELYRRGGTG